ncbi:hypothetical protein CHS0354_027984 [Potamilus streckersoni]|uniref:Uncharacterized protein n=1 Tax=Potamilus streckersoni TaxID=2493646 RepID=A0AAE0T4F6_9BIVA|nr:hypothetical protein CHS0354_027984 [Potamilus streckersoni]
MNNWMWDRQQGKFVPVVSAGLTGNFLQQHGENSQQGTLKDHRSFKTSNIKFRQSLQREMEMRKGSTKADGQGHEKMPNIEKYENRDNKLSGQSKRGQFQSGRRGHTADEKYIDVGSESGSEDKDENEEDNYHSEDTDIKMTEKLKVKPPKFKASIDSLKKVIIPQKKSMHSSDRKGFEVLIEETSGWIKQRIVNKEQLRTETEMPTAVQVSEDSEDDGQDLQYEEEFLEAVRNSNEKIEEMIRNLKIPKQRIMKTAVKQNGYTKGVQLALTEMSKLLRKDISQAVGIWCGYRIEDPHSPVFVVILKDQNCILKKEEVPKPFMNYEIIIRYKNVPNDEEISILEHYGCKNIRSEDIAHVKNCIAKNTERLMMEHSNLSIISPCAIKAHGYKRKKIEVIEDTCIVFYVPVKGIIPIGEKQLPKVIDGIITDVREGEFLFFGGHNAMQYHQQLRMGCCVSSTKIGSLGGFVSLPGDKIGCLTAAHVVLKDNHIVQYIKMKNEERKKLNDSLVEGEINIEMYQPEPLPGVKPFGRVQAIALDAGDIYTPSVDAAIIQITDDERRPEMGNFPDGDFEDVGFTKEDPMLFTSGAILDDIDPSQRGSLVIKFGCTTGITRGFLKWIGGSVRPVDVWGKYCFPAMFGQMEVTMRDFACEGDSGAMVFLCVGGNIRNLRAVGMVIGGSSTGCSCVVTPIKAVFEKLGLINNQLKVFPTKQLSLQETTSLPLAEQIVTHKHVLSMHKQILDTLSEKISSIEQNISLGLRNPDSPEQTMSKAFRRMDSLEKRVDSLEHNMKEGFRNTRNEVFGRVDSLQENMNQSFNRMTELLQNLHR